MTTHSIDDIELDEDVREGLLELAERDPKKAAALANESLRELIDYRQRFLASIRAGEADVAAGRTFSSEEARAELERRRRQR